VNYSVRKTIKIRPGFTPQEDVQRFRGTRQQDLDKRQLPPGHILGWVAPSSEAKKPSASGTAATSKSAAKNAKRNAKKKEEKQKTLEEKIRECWEDDDDIVKKPQAPRAESSGESSKADVKTKDTDGREEDEDDLAEGMSNLVV
jgi:partner of Y14 and mago protein